jgi:arylsulfatase A-like enzyme
VPVAWARLTNERREPFFLWLHYFGPHEKLFGPDETPQPIDDWAERQEMILRRYDPDVLIADEQVGRVLATLDDLGLIDETIVIVHADHGQSLNEHDYFGHGRTIYDPTQRIPLIIRFPDRLPAARRVTRMARNIDLFPTIAELLGIPLPVVTDGASLLPVMRGEESSPSEEVYVELFLSRGSW